MLKRTLLTALVSASLAMLALPAAEAAPIISVGSFPAVPPSYIPPLPAGSFLVPVEISGALNLQSWQFDLLFDNAVVEEVDPLDGSVGIYGAEFTPGDPNSLSFILGGFPFNAFGEVDTVAGEYPALLAGPSGDGVLAFIVFEFLPDQQNNNPGFSIANASAIQQQQQAPEPATLALLASGLVLLNVRRRVRREQRNEC